MRRGAPGAVALGTVVLLVAKQAGRGKALAPARVGAWLKPLLAAGKMAVPSIAKRKKCVKG